MRVWGLPRRSRCRRLILITSAFLLIACLIAAGCVAPWSHSNDLFTAFTSGVTVGPTTHFTVGAYLNNLIPSNTSYCAFPYGRAENFSVPENVVTTSPELGDKSPYRVIYYAVTGTRSNATTQGVTFATHATLEYLVHIAEVARTWDGPVSVACYLPAEDITPALTILEGICHCEPALSNVSIHFFYHVEYPMNLSSSSNGSVDECFVPRSLLQSSARSNLQLPYPVNVARNVARFGSRTDYLLVADIELFPSLGLASGFSDMLKRLHKKRSGEHSFLKKKHVYVVPVFEVAADVRRLPRTKKELLNLHSRERAVYFHRYVCLHCQRFPGLQQWLQRKEYPRSRSHVVQPLLVVKREFPHHRWEPVYIGTHREPLYSELLTWDGQQDKMTQMYEMCLEDYRFVILDGAFLVHSPGIKRKKEVAKDKGGNKTAQPATMATKTALPVSTESYRTEQLRRNAYLYKIITQDLLDKYDDNPRCRRY